MDELKNKAENLTDHVSDYLETYYKLTVLNATEKTAGIASVSVTAIFIGFLVLFVLLAAVRSGGRVARGTPQVWLSAMRSREADLSHPHLANPPRYLPCP